MKYYTKEWYELMQHTDYTMGVKKIPDKKYSEEEIQVFYKKALEKELAEERRCYNEPPCFLFADEDLDPETFDPEDWIVVEEESGTCKHIETIEDAKEHLEREQRQAQQEFENRPPFNPEETIAFFKQCYHAGMKSMQFPKWVYDKADRRLLALNLMPESVYLLLKQEEKANRKALRTIEKKAEKEAEQQRTLIPEEIYELFQYHDASVLSLGKKGRDITMVLRKDGMWHEEGFTPYDCITFRDAKLIEREKGLRILCRNEEGEYHSNCWYLYDELYRLEDGRYEFHLMVSTSTLKYITIQCREIVCEENIVL